MNEKVYIVVNQNTDNGYHSTDLKAYHSKADAQQEAMSEIEQAIKSWTSSFGRLAVLEDIDDDEPITGAVVDLSGADEGCFYVYENGNADMNEQCIYIKTTNVL